MLRYEPRGSVREQRSIATITNPAEKVKPIEAKKPSIITQETKKKLVKLDEESTITDDAPIQPDQKPIKPDVKQIKSNMQPIEPKVHTSYPFNLGALKSGEASEAKSKVSMDLSMDSFDEEIASMFTGDQSKTYKLVHNELVDYRVSIWTVFVDSIACL